MSFTKIYFNETTPNERCENFIHNNEENIHTERMGHICESYGNKYLILWGGHRVYASKSLIIILDLVKISFF
jgi:hypothetical protein